MHNDVITIVDRKDNPRLSKYVTLLIIHPSHGLSLLDIAYRFENLQEVESTLTYEPDTEECSSEVGPKQMEATKEEADEEVMDVTEGGVQQTEIDVGQKRKVYREWFTIYI